MLKISFSKWRQSIAAIILLASPTNIRWGYKGIARNKRSSLFAAASLTPKPGFLTLTPVRFVRGHSCWCGRARRGWPRRWRSRIGSCRTWPSGCSRRRSGREPRRSDERRRAGSPAVEAVKRFFVVAGGGDGVATLGATTLSIATLGMDCPCLYAECCYEKSRVYK